MTTFRVPSQSVLSCFAGRQRGQRRREREGPRAALALPGQPVALLALLHGVAQQLPQHLEVDPPVADDGREQRLQRRHVLRHHLAAAGRRIVARDTGDRVGGVVQTSSLPAGADMAASRRSFTDKARFGKRGPLDQRSRIPRRVEPVRHHAARVDHGVGFACHEPAVAGRRPHHAVGEGRHHPHYPVRG